MTLNFKILLKYNILVCLLGLVHPSLVAQEKDDYVWLFINGTSPGYATTIDFGYDDLKISLDTVKYQNSDVNASVSDINGKLLFYTNGCQVIQSDHQLMENGDSLNYGKFYVEWWENCTYGYNGFQDILILKDEMNEDIYYIIHKFINYETTPTFRFWMQDLRYTIVDMSYNGGRGKVIKKNQVFHEQHSLVFSYLTAIKHSNNRYWWMIQMNKTNNTYYKYLLKEDGPMLQDSQQIGPPATRNTSASGQAKFSPDGKMWAWYTKENGLNLFNFDRTSGLLSNQRILPIQHRRSFSGIEFSPNSRFVYITMYDSLMQVDLWKEDLAQGVELIDTFKYQQDPFANFHLMTLAPDCKIYMGSTNGTRTLHRINKPNKKGKECDFVQYDIDLLYYKGIGMANYPRLRVDYEDVCDSLEDYSGLDIDVSAPLSRIKVWPNPITDISIIDCSYSGHLKVYNNNGLEVISKYLDHTLPNYLDLEGYPSGMYIVRLIDAKGRSSTIKVIKT